MEEVGRHATKEDCWIVVKGKVYDVTGFLAEHPGGSEVIEANAGADVSEDFEAIHKPETWALLSNWCIGDVGGEYRPSRSSRAPPSWLRGHAQAAEAHTAPAEHAAPSAGGAPVALHPHKKIAVPLLSKEVLSRDTRRFRFGLPSGEHLLGLPIGQHVLLYATINERLVARAYTPVTPADARGHFDLCVKVYFAGADPRFPAGGAFSQHLERLAVGDTVDVKGPLGDVVYRGRGEFEVRGRARRCRRVAMVAGGTGLTPIYQVAQAMLRDPEDKTEIAILYANKTEGDVLLRPELEAMARAHAGRVRVWHTLDAAPPGGAWPYSLGYVDEAMVRAHLPGPEDSLALVCGPPAMLERAVGPALRAAGYPDDRVVAF